MSTKRQPIDYAAQVAARRAAAAGAPAPDAPTAPRGGGSGTTGVIETPPAVAESSSAQQVPGGEQESQTRTNEPVVAEGQRAASNGQTKQEEPKRRRIGVSADTPIAKKKVDRQGIDLRPIDRERWTRFEMFCLDRRLRLGKKRGLSQYARAGLQLLDELVTRDPDAAEALLQSVAEASPSDE